ncbi:M64 family metallopeptidase [Tahibacter sp.]|uniref:M64 family metallopeptidase n=1 Tax=Tahibacter sp. TaxID=2056211 RepID=UPI0028C4BE19|nr:M64 family metallopeptidase [Tahibacter sp.]
MRQSLAQHWFVRAACAIGLLASYGIAAAADTPGWLLLFDASRGTPESTAIVATDRFERGRDAGDDHAWRVELYDGAGHRIYVASVAAPHGFEDGDRTARRLTVRAPALPQAARIDLVDAQGAVVWTRRVDAALHEQARRSADTAKQRIELAVEPTAKIPRSDAIARLAADVERRRRDERSAAWNAYAREPTLTNWRALQIIREPAHAPALRSSPATSVPASTPMHKPFTVTPAAAPSTIVAPATNTATKTIASTNATMTYRGRLLGEDGLPTGQTFNGWMPDAGVTFTVGADGTYRFEADVGREFSFMASPEPPYPYQRLAATADAQGNVAEIRMPRGWLISGRLRTANGSTASGEFGVNVREAGSNTSGASAYTSNGSYLLAVPKHRPGAFVVTASNLDTPMRYVAMRHDIGVVDRDRSVDFVADPGIEIPVRPIGDGPVPGTAWEASCISAAGQTRASASGGTAALLRVRPGEANDCWFQAAVPYLPVGYPDLRFQASQRWFPALRRGNDVTFRIGGDAGSNYNGSASTFVDGIRTSLTNSNYDWRVVLPTGTATVMFDTLDGFAPYAIGPRRIDRDERIDAPLRRGATLRGRVLTTAPETGPRYGTVTARRTGDDTVVQTSTITNGAYILRLPVGTYDVTAEQFEDPAYNVLHYAPATRTAVPVTADATLDIDVAASARNVAVSISWPGCGVYYSAEIHVRENGRLLSRPEFGSSSFTCVGGRRTATSTLGVPAGEYELRVDPRGGEPTSWRVVDVRSGDASVAFDLPARREWRPQVLDAQRRPLATAEAMVVDRLGRMVFYNAADAAGRLTLPVDDDGLTAFVAPQSGGRALGTTVALTPQAASSGELVLDDLPVPDPEPASAVRTVLAAGREDPIRVLFIGDDYVRERETFTDTNGNGVWDGYAWYDLDGDGVYRSGRDIVNTHGQPTAALPDGSDPTALGEPFDDRNGDGIPNVDDEALFYANVENYVRDLFSGDYWPQRRGDFQVSAAFLASPQAGMTLRNSAGDTILTRSTLFAATHYANGGYMLVDYERATIAGEQLMPGHDLLVVLINQPVSTGRANATAGAMPAMITANGGNYYAAYASTPISHEAGHALGWLGDEYLEFDRASSVAESPMPNLSGRTTRDLVKWSDLVPLDVPLPSTFAHGGIGVFPGANRELSGMSRPSWNSIMRYGYLFDAVARRALDARLQKLLRDDAAPTPGNWYDRRRAGHGIDLQRYRRDPAGDIYFMVFYTYDQNGAPEWFQGLGRLNGDVLLPIADANGRTLTRVRGSGSGQGMPDNALSGDFSIDFRRNAVCKTDDRADAHALAAMQWSIGGQSAIWCIEPAVAATQHASPHYSGHWYAPADQGWGMEVTAIADGDGPPTLVAILYYLDSSGTPRWASALSPDFVSGQAMTVYEADNGYCRRCPAPATRTQAPIGRMTLTLTTATREDPASGANRADIEITPPGDGAPFRKTNVPITLLSEPLD